MTTFTDWMNNNIVRETLGSKVAKPLEMASGLTVSVQASDSHYCKPRETLSTYNNYEEFEMGFPSSVLPDEFTQYAEDASRLTETVYGWVPKELIEKLVKDNGGLV